MPTVLVTGASRGIGRAIASRLVTAGWDVVAGVRRSEDGDDLRSELGERITPVLLDITDNDQVAAMAAGLSALDAVVNNAGIAVLGPVEGLRLDDLRRQLEVNVVGQAAVTQAVLPLLRESRGRVVFVSSLSGRVATPLSGAYNASKFALEGLADALRVELRTWRVAVSLVEPAQVDTDIWRGAQESFDADVSRMSPEHQQLYARHVEGFRRTIPLSQKLAGPADGVAATVERALTARRPRARYVVGAGPKVQARLSGITPTPILDAMLGRALGVPRRPQ